MLHGNTGPREVLPGRVFGKKFEVVGKLSMFVSDRAMKVEIGRLKIREE